MTFNLGDVVHMKSSGPLMTVRERDGDSYVCGWFTNTSELKVDVFPESSLILAYPPTTPSNSKPIPPPSRIL
ncbi:MAG: YodC family protein [Nitrososphaeraceae archaeon]